MTKIAVASEGEMTTHHFGHCQNFNIFDAEDGKIVSEESVPPPEHKPGALPNFLHQKGVNVVIAGGMGKGAVNIFKKHGIEIIVGASGNAKQDAQDFLDGKLKSSNEVCAHNHDHEHEHHHGHGHHH